MKRLKVIAFFVIFIVCISSVVYSTELEKQAVIVEPPVMIEEWGWDFKIEGEQPNKINDEFNIVLDYKDEPMDGGPTFVYNSIDFSIKYPKNQVEFISTEVESNMYIIREVPEESEYGYIDCCVVNNDESIFSFLKFKFKAIAGGKINFIADIESVYATRFPPVRPPEYEGEDKVVVERFNNISEELVVDIPIEDSSINVIKKDGVCYLTGIDEKTPLGKITSWIPEEYTAIISTANGDYVINPDNTTLLKTGDTIIIAEKEIGDNTYIGIRKYKIIIYGDTNGDGKINSGDALAIIKNKTKDILFKSYEFKEAGRVQEKDRCTDVEPSAIDALFVVKHKLGRKKIVQ